MEHAGDDRGRVHAHVQQVFGYGNGMDDIGLAGLPLLPLVDSSGKGHGFFHGLPLLRAKLGVKFLKQFFPCHFYRKGDQRCR